MSLSHDGDRVGVIMTHRPIDEVSTDESDDAVRWIRDSRVLQEHQARQLNIRGLVQW